jgi:hypothetical protein
MSSYHKRLLRRPAITDPLMARLFTDTAEAVNTVHDGKTDHVFEDGAGPILKDTAGHYWRLSVTTAGAITTTDLGTDRP